MARKIRKAVIPAAGLGTRLLPITKVVPKELLPVGSKPAIQYVVEEAVEAGIEEIILVCSPNKMAVADYFRPDKDLNAFLARKGKKGSLEELKRIESSAEFRVVLQKEPAGLGHAILCAREAVGDEPFLVMLPDMILFGDGPSSTGELLATCRDNGDWGLLLERVSTERLSSYGLIDGEKVADGRYRVRRAVEKPPVHKAPSNLAILGRYAFPGEILDLLGRVKAGILGEIQLTDAINRLARENAGLGIVCRSEVFDVGVPEGLYRANQYLQGEEPPPLRRRFAT